MTIPVAATTAKPTNPIGLATGKRTEDKFNNLFRRLFNDGESISIDAEETIAGLRNGTMDGIWYGDIPPFTIRVMVCKNDDGDPEIEVSLSKRKPGDGSVHGSFTHRELELLSKYRVGVYDHKTQKASHLVHLHGDETDPRFEIPLSWCDQDLDPSVVLPLHRETDAQLPHSFSIFVVKNTEKK